MCEKSAEFCSAGFCRHPDMEYLARYNVGDFLLCNVRRYIRWWYERYHKRDGSREALSGLLCKSVFMGRQPRVVKVSEAVWKKCATGVHVWDCWENQVQ